MRNLRACIFLYTIYKDHLKHQHFVKRYTLLNPLNVYIIRAILNVNILTESLPDITDDGPGRHHHVNVGQHPVLRGIPEGVAEFRVVLDGHRVDRAAYLETALLELEIRNIKEHFDNVL